MKKHKCPICYKNKNLDSHLNGSCWGTEGIGTLSGGSELHYYCKKCFVEFTVKVTYIIYKKDIRKGMTGNTGCT